MMNNPLRILRTLDRHLHGPFVLHVYGRSALALGYAEGPAAFQVTMDVDAILPARDLRAIEANEDFWQAQERTNAELDDSGLYFTHLFEERQVILTDDWLDHTVPLPDFGFRHLVLRRPSSADLVLTKMMRVDPQDRDDIRFLLAQADNSAAQVRAALGRARIPEVAEIREAFEENQRWLQGWLEAT